jgi:NhaP-type Na+/H+ or K+/H+ antiporter
VALLAFGVAETVHGNGLLAAFGAGAAMAAGRREMPVAFVHLNESVSALLQVTTFFGFGALVVHVGWHPVPWRLLAFAGLILLVARPAAFLLSFVGAPFTFAEKVFMAWFGPRGVASMLFALLVLGSGDPHRVQVFQAAAFVILISVLAHGLTDTVGVRWLADRGRDLPAGPTVRP